MIRAVDKPTPEKLADETTSTIENHWVAIASSITAAEEQLEQLNGHIISRFTHGKALAPVLGITGTGGAGKSSLTDELIRRFLEHSG